MHGIEQCIGKVHDIRLGSYIFLFSIIPFLNSTFAVLLSLVKMLACPKACFFRFIRKQ